MVKVNEAYIYRVYEVIKISDGDSYWFEIELDNRVLDYGFNVRESSIKTTIQNFRLKGYDTPEIFSGKASAQEKELGLKAKKFVESVLLSSKDIRIHSFKDKKGKYGRYLCDVFYTTGFGVKNLGVELDTAKLLKKHVNEDINGQR